MTRSIVTKPVHTAELSDALSRQPALAQVYVGGFVNHPRDLVQCLVDLGEHARGTTVIASLPSRLRTPLKDWRMGRVVLTHSIDGFERAIDEGSATFRHTHLSSLADYLRIGCPRITFVRTTPPDADGRCHLGFSVDTTLDAIRGGELVVAEFDATLPRSAGSSWIHVDEIFMAIEATPMPQRAAVPSSADPTDAEQEVARRAAELIPDHATLELGMGRLPDLVADALRDRRGLRVHTGIVTSSLVRLLESGAVDDSSAAPFLAPVVATMASVEPDVWAALTTDRRIELHPASTTHDRRFLGCLPHFHAVNGALSVSLDGSVNCELNGTQRVAAVGGLMDFREGARLSAGGRFVVALTSTRPSGESRIVPALEGPATVPAPDAGWVVTEYGAVDLGPLDNAERAEALTDLAHPDHRHELRMAGSRR